MIISYHKILVEQKGNFLFRDFANPRLNLIRSTQAEDYTGLIHLRFVVAPILRALELNGYF